MPRVTNSLPLDAGDWFPWRMFVEAAGAACCVAVLALATVGLVVSELGAAALGRVLPGYGPAVVMPVTVGDLSLEPIDMVAGADVGLRGYSAGFVRPFLTVSAWWIGAWRLIVWSLFGAAITRVAVMRLTRHDEPGFGEAFRWAWATVLHRVGLLAALVLAVSAVWGASWLMRLGASLPVAGVVFEFCLPVVIALSGVASVLGLGVAIGWPLMTAAAGVERPDPFDTVSRGLAYAYQRPLRLMVYVGQSWMVGVLAGVVVQLVVRSTLWMSGIGAPGDEEPPSALTAFWLSEAERLPMIYYAAYFWCAVTAIYLLLRRDIDEQQADEVFLESPATEEPLPVDQPASA